MIEYPSPAFSVGTIGCDGVKGFKISYDLIKDLLKELVLLNLLNLFWLITEWWGIASERSRPKNQR